MIIKNANEFRFATFEKTHENLPVANYMLKYDSKYNEFYLIQQKDFTLPNKIYGNPSEFVDRVLKTYNYLNDSTGVFLNGTKGTGKTITAKLLAIQSRLPVIVINECFVDDSSTEGSFKEFINSITQEVVIFIDEFEKLYNYKSQEAFLDILDGASSSKKLFIFTSNSKIINEFLVNRLKRIRYKKSYDNISDELFDEVVEDLLLDKSHKEELRSVLFSVGISTLDILISVIEEINIHGLSPKKAVVDLNLDNESIYYDVYIKETDEFILEDYYRFTNFDFISKQIINIAGVNIDLSKAVVTKTKEGYHIKNNSTEYLLKERKNKEFLVF